jgi:DNA-binding XRE family transcriptional regulator
MPWRRDFATPTRTVAITIRNSRFGKARRKPIQARRIRCERNAHAVWPNCKAARIEAGLSQADIAESTGIPQSRVSQIELGKANITLETMMILARVIDRDLLYLLSRR